MEALGWTSPNRQGGLSNGVRIRSSPILADPSYLPCVEPEKVPAVQEFEREERPPSPVMVDDGEEYEVEVILRHKGKGARCLYLVMWKGYPITKTS